MALRLDHLEIEKDGFYLSADVEIRQGARLAVIGPSGAGKSTLFELLAGFQRPTKGHMQWNGAEMSGPPGKRPIAMVFQDNNLFPHLSLKRNAAMALTQKRTLSADIEAKLDEVLERVGLAGLGDRLPSQVSGGQQSRAALARLLLQDKPIWLLDEPFAALGPALKREMLALVREISEGQGGTVLMITHDPKDALEFADQSLLVADGKVTGPFDTADLFADPPEALKSYLG